MKVKLKSLISMSNITLALDNANRLNIPKKHIGVSWADIIEFCEAYSNAGVSEEVINEKLTAAIMKAQNLYYTEKNGVQKSVKENSVDTSAIEKEVDDKKVVKVVTSQKEKKSKKVQKVKPLKNWQKYLRNKDDFENLSFSLREIFDTNFNTHKKKEIMSLVIGKQGCFFKEWTNYWDVGSIMYYKNTNEIFIAFHKKDKKKTNKFEIMKSFITTNININIEKYNHIHKY